MNRFTTLIAVLLLAAGTASAGSLAPESMALGYQTEHADLVVMGRLAGVAGDEHGNLRATFSVTETIRGDVVVGSNVVVIHSHGAHRPPWQGDREHLLFLVRRGSTSDCAPLAGPVSIRAIPENGPVARLPGMARQIAATLPADGREADSAALRSLLVTWMRDEDPGVVWSAAVDFVRRRDLHAGLTASDRLKVLEAFVAHPFGKAGKDALVMAVAAARPEGAGAALVSALGGTRGRTIRGTVAEALLELSDPAVPGMIAAGLGAADAAKRADLVMVLGAVGGAESVDVTRRLVADGSAEVRVEAAHALGRIARNVRESKPDAKVAGTTDLEGMLAAAKTGRERQAALWALAQLQDPEAVALLTKLAKDGAREDVRSWAARYRTRPRLSLILR